LQQIDSIDEYVDDFNLKKAQARKIMKALKWWLIITTLA
jgi:hypothetical protein